jgi:hypothetical protein
MILRADEKMVMAASYGVTRDVRRGEPMFDRVRSIP